MATNKSEVKFVEISRAKFNALTTTDGNTFYVVKETDGTKKLYQGSAVLTPEGSSGGGLIKVSYSELVDLKSNAELVAGAVYRITDYETTTTQPNTRSAGHLFDIIIQALSESELAEVGTAIEHEGENYFANAGAKLGAWQIWYDINNDTERYEWADEVNGKGVIYRMIDEHMNDLPYDFKNIQFKRMFDSNGAEFADRWSLSGSGVDRYLYTFNVIDENDKNNDSTVIAFQSEDGFWIMSHHNSIEVKITETENSVNKVMYRLGGSVFLYDYDLSGYWEFYGFYNNTIGNGFSYNTIGNGFNSNTIGNNFYSNTIGNFFSFNTIGNGFNYNTIGNNFNDNTVGNSVKYIQFSVDGTFENEIRYLYLKNGLSGASSNNLLDLYYAGLYHRQYPTTFEIIANGNIVSSWEATPLTRAGKVKETETTATWSDI